MRARRLNGALGAVVEGVELETISDDEFAEVSRLVLTHQVVILRDQHLSDDGHRALAHRFGTPTVYPFSAFFGGTEYLTFIEDTAESPPDADGWHTDITWVEQPPRVAILCALVSPPYGGDTLWADLYGAWEHLSPTMQEMLRPLEAHHAPSEMLWETMQRTRAEHIPAMREAFPGVVHPLVQTHPETGRTVLFSGGYFLRSILGLRPDESDWLVGWIQQRVEDPNLQVRWSWQVGDVAIWDERSTNHRALSDHYPQHRRMRRCTVNGASL